MCITPVGADQAGRRESRKVGRGFLGRIKCGGKQGAQVGGQAGRRQGSRSMGRCADGEEGRLKGRQTGKRKASGKIGRTGCQLPVDSCQRKEGRQAGSQPEGGGQGVGRPHRMWGHARCARRRSGRPEAGGQADGKAYR